MNYIAYTIGPIYDTIFETLNGDNKTKKLYAGSYFFSYFMKTVLKNIKDEFNVIVPFVEGNVLDNEYSMGLFHDRFIASSNKSKDEMLQIFDEKLSITCKALAKEIEDESISSSLLENMDNNLIVLSENELKDIDENIIFAINRVLDSKELQRNFSFDEKTNYIKKYQDSFVQNSHKKVKNLEKLSYGFNYYAVITADGDKMGEKIKKESTINPNDIKKISEKLFNFFVLDDDIHEITNNHFGGELIYAGGDDILAFVPVKFENRTFLDYIKILDDRFKKVVGDDVSLSFGINIAYYKYPLRDAIEGAFELLYDAKKHNKNSISMKTTKHSGQYFGSTLELSSNKYAKLKILIEDVIQEKITIPHSIHHSLKRYEEVIIESFKCENTSLDAMFKTVFNDVKNEKETKGLEDIKEFIKAYQPQNSSEFNEVFSALSLIKFLREDRK